MLSLFRKKPNKQFNLENSYMIIEFLTQDQKIKKDKIINELQKQYQNSLQTIIPYADSFQCSYRYTLYSKTIKGKILLAEVMALIQASADVIFQQFYEENVKKIKLHLKNGKMVNAQDVMQLYNQRDVNVYNPQDVLEVIYEKKGLFERIKTKGKKFIKNIPRYFLNLIGKLFGMVLQFLGLGSSCQIISKFLPFKLILNWAINILMLFFPMLAPILGISKLMI